MVPSSVSISAWSGTGNLLGRGGKTSMFCFFFFIFQIPPFPACVAQQPAAVKEPASPRCASLTAAFCRAGGVSRRQGHPLPKGFEWLRFCLHDTLLPAGGRADGGNEKSRMTVKNLPIPTPQKSSQDFCVHAALGRLRFVSGSTAQLLYLIGFSISGTGVRVKIPNEKSVRVRGKFTWARAWDWDLREQQAQQVYVHLRKSVLAIPE